MGGRGSKSRTSLQSVVHHHPPRENAADVGYPVRGGQTLLIAYFPWEATESDIEREFAKFCRVKRVHLVVDKSSRKPRCFGFVKFMTKADAEEALRATMQGLVQLPDTRGHVWHLKAEWTKTGDMVVDDSETELEVAKRKEERRYRTGDGYRGPGGGSGPCLPVAFEPDRYDLPGDSPRLRRSPTAPPGSGLHPGVPAPLPPLQSRHSSLVAFAQQGQPQQQILPAACQIPPQQSYQGAPHAPSAYSGLGAGVASMPRDPLPQHQVHALLRESLGASQGYVQASPGYAAQGYLSGQATYPAGVQGQQSYGPNGQQAFLSQSLQQQAFSSYSLGQQSLVQHSLQHGVPPGHSSQQGTYGYIQQSTVAPAAPTALQNPGVVTYSGYTGGAASATTAQDSMAGMPQMMHNSSQQQLHQQPKQPLQRQQPQQQLQHSPQSVRVSGKAAAGSELRTLPLQPSDGTDAQYLEAVWQLSEMSLKEKGTLDSSASGQSQPATLVPPTQQPPAPPSGWQGEALTATSTLPAGSTEGEWRVGMTQPAAVPSAHSGPSGGPAAVWNSFDDAAAKGMVDGLVGREDCMPPVTAWRNTAHAS